MKKADFVEYIKEDYFRFLNRAVHDCIVLDNNKAFMPAGQNGPHFALETPVRNTCHWLIAFLIGNKLRPQEDYSKTVVALLNWLLDECIFFRNNGYVLRQKGRSDWSNGVIGHAWVMESLYRASSYLGNSRALALARALYECHRFNGHVGAWHRFDPHNKKYSIDYTLNHQAWIAAAATDLEEIEDVARFLSSCMAGAFRVTESGRIRLLYYSSSMEGLIYRAHFYYRQRKMPRFIAEVEEGYQHYALLPFARIHSRLPKHPFFASQHFRDALAYCGDNWLESIEKNRFSYGYNAPGFELPIILSVFYDDVNLDWCRMRDIYDRQMQYVGNDSRDFCSRGNQDPLTLSSRIYELGLFLEQDSLTNKDRS